MSEIFSEVPKKRSRRYNMARNNFWLKVLCLLLQLATLQADEDHEHVHIKLHLPQIIKKHSHVRMVYKHHFHPKKTSKVHSLLLDPLPLLDRPLLDSGPPIDFYKTWGNSEIVNIKKPKRIAPFISDWHVPHSHKISHKFAPAVYENFEVSFPKHKLSKNLKHFHKFNHFDDYGDEYVSEEDSSRSYPSVLSKHNAIYPGSNLGTRDAQWSSDDNYGSFLDSPMKDQFHSNYNSFPAKHAANNYIDIPDGYEMSHKRPKGRKSNRPRETPFRIQI